MSIAKGLILLIFLIMFFIIIALKRENSKQKDLFIKTLSHDFRVATLAQLRGIEILSKSINFDIKQAELIDEIDKSCRYSLDMISMLMNTYLFEKGKQIVNFENFMLCEVLNTIFKVVENQLKEKNIDLFFDLDNLQRINMDKNLTFKLILNLITTAISYSKSNSIIKLSSKINNNLWEFDITYCGKSLSEEECGRMFSYKAHFSTVGHGIKMYFCKKIVDFHKGKIFVKNFSEKLNSFTFYIPQKQKNNIPKSLAIRGFKSDKLPLNV